MDWKEQFDKLNHPYEGIFTNEGIDFISTEIIEKLIEDIPDTNVETILGDDITEIRTSLVYLRQQLRDKWLK